MIRRSVTTVAAVAVALLLSGLLLGCAAPKPPDTEPSIRGVITNVTPRADGFWVILIEETSPEGFEFDKASLAITKDTTILKPVGDGYQVVTLEEPIEGLFVDAWVTGPVRESYPIQADADVVVLLD